MADNLDWSKYRLPQIWEMVKYESGSLGAKQQQAWEDTATLCDEQADQLDRAAAQLAQTWVPTDGSAAVAFQNWIRRYTASMRQSARLARDNARTIVTLATQLASARDRIHELVLLNNKYQAADASQLPPAVRFDQPKPPPRRTEVERPPDNWQMSLDQQARDIMAHTENTVVAQAKQVQHDPPFVLSEGPNEQAQPHSPSDPAANGGSTSGLGGRAYIASGIPAPTFPPPPPIPFTLESSAASGTDPVLNGRELGTGPGGMATTWPPPSQTGGMVSTPVGPALAPGGLIGAPVGSPSAPGTGRSPSATTSPAGRGGTAASGRSAASTVPMAPMIPPGGARPGSGGAASPGYASGVRRRRSTDPNDPWFVAEGGPSVLQPPPEPDEHDPGPGVIGIDR